MTELEDLAVVMDAMLHTPMGADPYDDAATTVALMISLLSRKEATE
jgi:hypothetical protein